MKVLHFLAKETQAPRQAILAMACLSGAANALLLALINGGAEQVSDSALKTQQVALYLIAFALYLAAQHYALTRSVEAVEQALEQVKVRVADKVRRSGLRFVEEQGGIAAFSSLTQDAGSISQGVPMLVSAAQSALLLVCATFYLASISPASMLAVSVVYGAAIPVYLAGYVRTRAELAQAADREGLFFEGFTGLLGGFKELKLNRAASDDLFGRLRAIARQAYDLKLAASGRQVQGMILASTSFYLVLLAVVFAIPAAIPEASGTVHKVAATVLFVIGPLGQLVSASPVLAKADATVGALYALEERLDRAAGAAEENGPRAPWRAFERIELKAVRFDYTDRHGRALFSVGPIDLELKRGELLFVVGGNGSGKSTLLKLLTGLYRVDAGEILIDGRALAARDYAGYRGLFASVFADFHLFDRIYGVPDLDPAEVDRWIERMGLAGKTRYSDEGFSEIALSTGQRKRLAFVGAVLTGRPICVFDELAADQDPEFRRCYYEEILPGLRASGTTVVVVSHDDRWFHVADRVLRLSDGQIEAA